MNKFDAITQDMFNPLNNGKVEKKQEKKMERLYTTCDLPAAPTDFMAPVRTLQNEAGAYITFLRQQLPSAGTPPITIALSGSPFVQHLAEEVLQRTGIQLVPYANKTPADFSVTFSKNGEQLDLYDETGALISEERISVLISFLLLE